MATTVVWAHLGTAEQLRTLIGLVDRMDEDGDAPLLVITGSPELRHMARDRGITADDGPGVPRVGGARPDILLWMIPDLNARLLQRAQDTPMTRVYLDAGSGGVLPKAGLLPGRLRRRLAGFDHIIATDAAKAEALIKRGAPRGIIKPLGHFRDIPLPEPTGSKHAQKLAAEIGPRPIWMAQNVPAAELDLILDAHLRVSRHAPRLLLALDVSEPKLRDEAAAKTQARHLETLVMEGGTAPEDLHQVVILPDTDHDSCWLRLATIAYLGGSLSTGTKTDPLVAAQLGAVVVHGNATGRFGASLALLSDAKASVRIMTPAELPDRLIELLSPAEAAEYAAAAWQVISEGANATNFVVDVIRGEA